MGGAEELVTNRRGRGVGEGDLKPNTAFSYSFRREIELNRTSSKWKNLSIRQIFFHLDGRYQ